MFCAFVSQFHVVLQYNRAEVRQCDDSRSQSRNSGGGVQRVSRWLAEMREFVAALLLLGGLS